MPQTTEQTQEQLNDLAITKDYIIDMYYDPRKWSQINSTITWQVEDFPPTVRSSIPRQSGVYAFVLKPDIFNFDVIAGLLYVGKATQLYSRIASYISEIDKNHLISTRPNIWKMINKWNGHLKYYYTITNTVEEAEALEDEMIDAFVPYFNKSYNAETSQNWRAF